MLYPAELRARISKLTSEVVNVSLWFLIYARVAKLSIHAE